VFPCFDQPDLKAEWTFSATTPSDWIALSNDSLVLDLSEETKAASAATLKQAAQLFEQDESKLDGGFLQVFNKSPKISTYLYAIAAGPYEFIERNDEGFPPMRIYLRKSLKSDWAPERGQEMFSVT